MTNLEQARQAIEDLKTKAVAAARGVLEQFREAVEDLDPLRPPQLYRPDWDAYFMAFAVLAASRSTCIRKNGHQGAVLVRDRQILATGYNGVPAGAPHPQETGCLRDKLNVPSGQRRELNCCLHAEMNALGQAAKRGQSTTGSTIYVTARPCAACTQQLLASDVVEVVFFRDYPDVHARELSRLHGLVVRQYEGPVLVPLWTETIENVIQSPESNEDQVVKDHYRRSLSLPDSTTVNNNDKNNT